MCKQVRLGQYFVASLVLSIHVKEMKVYLNCMFTVLQLFEALSSIANTIVHPGLV